MIDIEIACRIRSDATLVKTLCCESNSEGLDPVNVAMRHAFDNPRRVEPAGKERSDRHVADHLAADRPVENPVESIERLRYRRRGRLGNGGIPGPPFILSRKGVSLHRRRRDLGYAVETG